MLLPSLYRIAELTSLCIVPSRELVAKTLYIVQLKNIHLVCSAVCQETMST